MAWTYHHASGRLYHHEILVSARQQGEGSARQTASLQQQLAALPCGRYVIGAPFPHPRAGNYALRLTPAAGQPSHRQDEWLIRGTENGGQPGAGAIVAPIDVRSRIWHSGDRQLQVLR